MFLQIVSFLPGLSADLSAFFFPPLLFCETALSYDLVYSPSILQDATLTCYGCTVQCIREKSDFNVFI